MIIPTMWNYPIDKSNVGVSEFNMYKPLFTNAFNYWFKDTDLEYYCYIDFERIELSFQIVSRYSAVIRALTGGKPVIFRKTNSFIHNGSIFELNTGMPLLMLSYENVPTQEQMKSHVLFSPINKDGTPQFEKFVLYINKDLTNLELYKNLWKRLQKGYIPYFQEHDIPLIITSGKKIMKDNFDDGLNYKERIKTIMDIPILVEEVKTLLPEPSDENPNTLAES